MRELPKLVRYRTNEILRRATVIEVLVAAARDNRIVVDGQPCYLLILDYELEALALWLSNPANINALCERGAIVVPVRLSGSLRVTRASTSAWARLRRFLRLGL